MKNCNSKLKIGSSSTTFDKAKSGAGFTLVELLVSSSIFLVVITIVSGFFISSLKSQNQVFARQELLNQASYVMEYMSRALRMADKDLSGECIGVNENYEIAVDGRGILFMNYAGNCQSFYLDENDSLKEEKNVPGEVGIPVLLISNRIKINDFKVSILGESQTDNVQPRVTLFLNIEENSPMYGSAQSIKIQTTISQRNIDIER